MMCNALFPSYDLTSRSPPSFKVSYDSHTQMVSYNLNESSNDVYMYDKVYLALSEEAV